MEMNSHLLSLQKELRNLEKSTGKFAKIKYKGGNEEKIINIIKIIGEYVSETCPLKERENKPRQTFLTFLILNTNFKNNSLLLIEEFQHQIDFIPVLSTCLLANIIIDLEFVKEYPYLIQILSLQMNKQLIYEIEICLKQYELPKTLKDTCDILKAIIFLFSSASEDSEYLQQIGDIFKEILKNFSRFNPEKIEKWTISRLHEHIGYCLLNILKLLNECPLYHYNTSRIVDGIIDVSIEVMKAVTLHVFCVWAEVNYDDGTPLQLVIAGEAYSTIEHLHKYEPGHELVQILGTIAKKPKTLAEKIAEADLPVIINNINRCDDNQKLWFRALVSTNVFENDGAIACLDKWHTLCTSDDVFRLLHLSITSRDKEITLKCAELLNVEELHAVTTKYFWGYGNFWNVDVSYNLILLLNKTENGDDEDDNFLKQIYLLLIQNREVVLNTLYKKCLTKAVNVRNFKKAFRAIKSIVKINDFAKVLFEEVFFNEYPTNENILCYKELLDMLLELSYFTEHAIVCDIFKGRLLKLHKDDSDETLLSTLKILNLIAVKFELNNDAIPLIIIALNLMEKYRCQLCVSSVAQQMVQECVTLLLKYGKTGKYPQAEEILSQLELSPLNKFYVSNLYSNTDNKLLRYVYSSWNTKNSAESVARLFKVLPLCVKSEWILIIKEMELEEDYATILKFFNDVLFLLCQIVKSQEENHELNSRMTFCLHQYAIVIKEGLQPTYNTLKDEQTLAKSICTLLKNIPQDIRDKESARLTGLLSNEVLAALKDDREFILSLIAIQDVAISQLLAQRML